MWQLGIGSPRESHTSLLGRTRTFFLAGQGWYSIVASSIKTTLSHCYKFHCRCIFAKSLCVSSCLGLHKGFFFGIFRRKLDSLRIFSTFVRSSPTSVVLVISRRVSLEFSSTSDFYNLLSCCFCDLWRAFVGRSILDITPMFITFFYYITHLWLRQP